MTPRRGTEPVPGLRRAAPAAPVAPARRGDAVLRVQGMLGNRATAKLMRDAGPTADPVSATPSTPLPGSLRVRLVAHASPRWRSATSAGQADQANLDLSRERLAAVKAAVDAELRQLVGADTHIDYDVEYADPDQAGTVLETGEAHGSQDTLREAKGNRAANDPYYRRVDLYIDDTERSVEHTGVSVVPTTNRVQHLSTHWGVDVRMSAAITAGASAGIIVVRLINRETGRYGDYHLISGGGGTLGVGAAMPFSDDYTDFETDSPVGFDAFDGAWTRYTSLGAGAVFVGYQRAHISFMGLGDDAQGISVSGWNYGAHLDLGGSVTTGKLSADGSAESDYYDETDPNPGQESVPYQHSSVQQNLETVLFPTGSAALSATELASLREYVSAAAGRFAGETH